ncbi:hypothetical protein COCVIDRAFT_110923 [Bipolaris victoriae FI3]|uniref:SET domain-containing protein n=1 Tax=Bipolaris victoriae (strain FI3) TaxID=930091 RepID=W7E351_BIPV3|nr:hypothetical protein COCVIDRAFT_110923 [Bipolaris victoriae FI3]
MDVRKDLDEYTQIMQQQKRVLQDAKKKQGQYPRDRKGRDIMLFEFTMASVANTQRAGSEDTQTIHSSFVPPAYPPCTTSLGDLKPIAIEGLRLETHHRGCYLILRAITPPNRMTAILVLVEDEHGDVTLLQLYQQEDEASRPASTVVDKGSVLLIKEPFFKITASGDYSLRVDHLSDIIFLGNNDSRIPQSWRQGLFKSGRSADSLKLEGNGFIGKGEYWRAIDKYSDALAHPATPDEIQVIKRNRSLAYLKTRQYDAALSDTGFPDFGVEASEKALFRAAEALYHLTRYEECCSVLEKLCRLFPNNKEAVAAHTRARNRVRESSTGEFDFRLLQAEARKRIPPHLDHGTYIGPVTVKKAKGKGRGLFTTASMKAGDLVLCEKAFCHAHVDEPGKGNAKVTLLMNVETERAFMGGQAHLIQLITQKLYKSPSMAAAFTELHHGDYKAVDKMFVDEQPVVDTFLVERTMALNVFGCPVTSLKSHSDVMSSKLSKRDSVFDSCGIWIKASYINHSCLGNVRRSFIGDMMIVRACKNLEAGVELAFPYEAPRGDYVPQVEQKFKNWGFICRCALCEDIKTTKPSEVAKRRSLLDQLDRLCKAGLTAHNVPTKLERLIMALDETYKRPAEEVPRLLLLDPQLLLTRVYMEKLNPTKVLESVAKTLHTQGFIVTGLDQTRSALVIHKWGHIMDHMLEIFLHGQSAFEQLRIWEKSKQAEQYARVAYRILVGEEASFNRTCNTEL